MKNENRNQGLDILRCLAILGVLFLHASDVVQGIPVIFHQIFAFGWSGVDLFFILSGFLIGRQVFTSDDGQGKKVTLKKFWIKRWFRTLPLYFVVLFVYVAIKPMAGFPFVDWNWSFLVFLQNYFHPMDFVQSWSLCIEEQFYIVFPILAYLLAWKNRSPLLWLLPLLFSLSYRTFMWQRGDFDGANMIDLSYMVRFPFHTHLDGISMGVFLAATFNYWIKWDQFKKTMIGISGFILFLVAYFLCSPEPLNQQAVWCYSLLSVAFACLLIGSYEWKIQPRYFIPVQKIALWSYGLYLWNNLVMRLFIKWPLPLPWWVNTLLFIGMSCLISFGTYRWVEVPFLKVRDVLLLKFSKKT